MNRPEFEQNYIVPPGCTIQECIDDSDITRNELAGLMGETLTDINKLMKGDIALTNNMAIKLEDIFGISYAFWNQLQKDYEKERTERSN